MKNRILILLALSLAASGFQKARCQNREFRLAVAQMYVEPGNLKKNISRASELIAEASRNKADIILLPEIMDLGWTHPSAKTLSGAIPGGETCNALCMAAEKNNIYVCCGITEKDGDSVYNSAMIIDNKGQVILKHRKLNELDIAHKLYAQGDRLGVCKTPFGTLGLLICADARAKDFMLSRSLGYMGADVILSPSSWAVKPDHDNLKEPYGKDWLDAYSPVAREFSLWIASASNVGPVTEGPWKDWKCIGCSMVVDPEGKQVLGGPYGEHSESLMYCTIKPTARPARGTGWYGYKPKN